MNKEILSIALAFGCIAANATSNNYDLLGRKGSKMNSPMVYKNVDYSKTKKNDQQKLGSSLENRSLAKTGMPNSTLAIKGARSTKSGGNYLIRVYKSNGSIIGCNDAQDYCYLWDTYKNVLNKYFIPIKNETTNYWSQGTEAGWTNVDPSIWNYAAQTIDFPDHLQGINETILHNSSVGTPSYYSEVGVFLGMDGLPVKLYNSRPVRYFKVNNTDVFNNYPGPEKDASQIYNLVAEGGGNSIFFIGKSKPTNPAEFTPQIYVGLRNTSKSRTGSYGSIAKEIDNFIYQYRTVEFIPAGNHGPHNANGPRLTTAAYAANAITVGAVDFASNAVSSNTSTANNQNTQYQGTQKPEIYNYTNFYGYGKTKTYDRINGTLSYTYYPYFEGTEAAASYTAGMVSRLLTSYPFYRWHPEVVKALLLTSEDGWLINPPYPPGMVTKTAPNYKYLVNKRLYHSGEFYDIDSRYWNGDINKLKTRTANNKHEIWFIVSGGDWGPKSAAIAWLSSGNDIYNNGGKVPQNFDLTVYGSNNSYYGCWADDPNADLNVRCNGHDFDFNHPGTSLDVSNSPYNSFEKVNIPSPNQYNYYVFKIVLENEYSASENKGQIVLGFNMASPDMFPQE